MTLRLDHLVICATHLDAVRGGVEAQLGAAFDAGGPHDGMGTRNAVMALGPELYLELIAPDPDAAAPEGGRLYGLDRLQGPPRLSHWVLAADDLDAALVRAPEGVEPPVTMRRGGLSWRLAAAQRRAPLMDGVFPALIEWQGSARPGDALGENGCRLQRLVVRHPRIAALREALAGFDDDRVAFETGPAGLDVVLQTPHGPRRLPAE